MILHQKWTNFSLEDSIKQTDGLSKILFGSLKEVKILSTEFGNLYARAPRDQAYAWRSESELLGQWEAIAMLELRHMYGISRFVSVFITKWVS